MYAGPHAPPTAARPESHPLPRLIPHRAHCLAPNTPVTSRRPSLSTLIP